MLISAAELLADLDGILRRAEDGEDFTLTVDGRPVARLGPATRRQWVPAPELAKLWRTAHPKTLTRDLDTFGAQLRDPFED